MSFASDKRYGRRGGRFAAPATPKPKPAPVLPVPVGPAELRVHLLAEHQPITAAVLNAASPTQWRIWHDAEHRTRAGGGVLHHTHAAGVDAGTDPEHAAYLRQARSGKLTGAVLDTILDRAQMATARRAEGRPLSQYDKNCIEIAQVVADRSARLARRRGAA